MRSPQFHILFINILWTPDYEGVATYDALTRVRRNDRQRTCRRENLLYDGGGGAIEEQVVLARTDLTI